MWIWLLSAALAGESVRAQVALDGDTYAVNGSEYVWCTMAIRLFDERGVVLSTAVAQPRMEVGCRQEGTRQGALASYRAWYAGGGWDVDLVRRGDTLALLRTPVDMGGRVGASEVYLAVGLPADARLSLLPTLEPAYGWFDASATAEGIDLKLVTGDPPQRMAGVTVRLAGCQRLDTWDDADAKAAFQCADGMVYARRRGPDAVGLVTAQGVTLAQFAVPEGVRTDW